MFLFSNNTSFLAMLRIKYHQKAKENFNTFVSFVYMYKISKITLIPLVAFLKGINVDKMRNKAKGLELHNKKKDQRYRMINIFMNVYHPVSLIFFMLDPVVTLEDVSKKS